MDSEFTYNKDEYEDMSLKEAQLMMADILEAIHNICEKHNIKYFLDAGTLLGAVRHQGFIPWDDDADIGMLREDYNKFIEVCKKELPKNLFLQTFETDKYYDVFPVPCKIRYNGTILFERELKDNYKMHNGVYVDIIPYDSLPKSKFVYKIQRVISFNILKSLKRISNMPDKLSFKNLFTYSFYKIVALTFPYKRRKKFFDFLIKWNDVNSEYMGYGVDTFWFEYIYKKEYFFDLIKLNFEGKQFYAPRNYDAVLTQLYGDYMKLPPENERVWHSKEIKKLKTLK
ncbi:MAG: LicD family protein [Clostridium butyricum]|nr:LicD family protein [Clostridium butyricum]